MTKTLRQNPDGQTWTAHLDELRGRLIICIFSFIVLSGFFYFFVDDVWKVLIKPVGKLVFIAPAEAFLARWTLTFWGGLFLAFPVIVYQVWGFVAAGLSDQERRYVRWTVAWAVLLFIVGSVFAYVIMVPMSLRFFLSFSDESVIPMITLRSYVSFVGTMVFSSGIIFETPVVLFFLTKIGVADPTYLVRKRKHAVVAILVLSALLTPPDVMSQVILAVPFVLFYEIGVIVSKIAFRRNKYAG